MPTRAEHVAWAKERALEYVEAGQLTDAWASIVSDFGKHEATVGHYGLMLGSQLVAAGHLSTAAAMRKFIEGFA
jgi:hypothetical protein